MTMSSNNCFSLSCCYANGCAHPRGEESEVGLQLNIHISLEHGANAKLVLNRFNRLKSRWFFTTNCGFLTWLMDISVQKGEERRILRNLELMTVNKPVNRPIPPPIISTSDAVGFDLLMRDVDHARLPNIAQQTDADQAMGNRIKIENPSPQSCRLNVRQDNGCNQGNSTLSHIYDIQTSRHDNDVSTITSEKDDTFLHQNDEITKVIDEDEGIMIKSDSTQSLGLDNMDKNCNTEKEVERKNKDSAVDKKSPADETITRQVVALEKIKDLGGKEGKKDEPTSSSDKSIALVSLLINRKPSTGSKKSQGKKLPSKKKPICSSKLKTKTSITEKEEPKPVGSYCQHCDRPFVTNHGLILHTKNCSQRNNPFHYCDVCHRPFFGLIGLKQHKKNCCDGKKILNYEKPITEIAPEHSNDHATGVLQVAVQAVTEIQHGSVSSCKLESNNDVRVVESSTATHRELIEENSNQNDNISKDSIPRSIKSEVDSNRDDISKDSVLNLVESEKQLYKCERCSKQFKFSGMLKRHMRLSVKGKDCEKCNMKFCSPKDFNKHQLLHMTERKDGDFTCHDCGEKLTSQRMLSSHLKRAARQVTPSECQTCNKHFCLSQDLQRHLVVHKRPTVFECNICNRVFKGQSALTQHLRTHENVSLDCDICGKLFRTKRNLNEHRKTHAPEKNHKCDICDKRFNSLFKLTSHKVAVHKQEGKYRCSVCGKSIPTMARLKLHLISHTGEKNFNCDICNKPFKDKSHMREHIRGVHEVDVRHRCTHCKRGFYSKGRFEKHMRYHLGIKPYSCHVCEKTFYNNSALVRHLRTHTGECPYECQICKKKMKDLGNYKLHLRIHSGEKPYECNICNKRFASASNRNKHMRVHQQKTDDQSTISENISTL